MPKAVPLMQNRRCCQTWPQKRKTFGIESGPGYSMTCCPWTRKRHRCPPRRGHHHQAKRPLCSGRPNITGSTSWDVNGLGKAGVGYSSCGSSRISNNGAMSVSTGTYWACIGSSGADCGNNAVVNINAKNSNSVYGSSSVVQPSSTRLLMCIKS